MINLFMLGEKIIELIMEGGIFAPIEMVIRIFFKYYYNSIAFY